ncbi:MAG: magnesium transporter, partial [Microbacteriaceae bacterium]|nr:magnesium transporter [Microbacteriaceae bacterium]
MTLTRLYRNGKRDDTPFPLEDISELIKEESITVWADFVDPSAKDLELIEDELGLHELAIEDALTGH